MKKILAILLLVIIALHSEAQIQKWTGTIDKEGNFYDSTTAAIISDLKYIGNVDTTLNYLNCEDSTQIIINSDTVYLSSLFSNYRLDSTDFFFFENKELRNDSVKIKPRRLVKFERYAVPTQPPVGISALHLTSGMITVCNSGCDYTNTASAISAASTGDTIIIIKAIDNSAINLTKQITVISVGDWKIKGYGNSYGMLITGNPCELTGVQITGDATAEGIFIFNNSNSVDATLNNATIIADGSWGIKIQAGLIGKAKIFNSYVKFNGSLWCFEDRGDFTKIIDSKIITSNTLYRPQIDNASIMFSYCDIKCPAGVTLSNFNVDSLQLVGNKISASGLFVDINQPINYVDSKHNVCDVGGRYLSSSGAGDIWINLINDSINSQGSASIISVEGSNISAINSNYIQWGNASAVSLGISTPQVLREFIVDSCYLYGDTTSIMTIGAEIATNDSLYWKGIFSNSIMSGNYQNTDLTQHGIFVYNQDSVHVVNSEFKNSDLNIVYKATNVSYADCFAANNILRNGRLVIKGCHDLEFKKATFYNDNNNFALVNSIPNLAIPSFNNKVFDCIFYNTVSGQPVNEAAIYSIAFDEELITYNNVLYATNSDSLALIGSNYYTFFGIQDQGLDTNSYKTNPNFVNSPVDLRPTNPSNAIGNATDGGDIGALQALITGLKALIKDFGGKINDFAE